MTLQMHIYTVFANVYTPAKFHQYRMKNDREMATSGFFYFVSLWPWPLTFAPQKVHSSSTSHYLSYGQVSSRSDNKWQRNRVTQVAVKKKNKMKKTRIEPVGKPYREVCLRSELWPWMAHQPNSWSKHPGTRIEQVLAYCRDEQKYVGCIELLFCLTVTMTFGVQTWNFIGLIDEIVPIYPPSFTEIRSKIREK